MKTLTDLEIVKKIAEIEGVYDEINSKINAHNQRGNQWDKTPNSGVTNPYGRLKLTCVYNPLTDKALLMDLILKHRVSLVQNGNGDNHAFFMDKDVDIYEPEKTKIPRAVLLAIIEAHDNG